MLTKLRKLAAERAASPVAFRAVEDDPGPFVRTAGELSRKEGGKVFGQGSRSTVAILLLVKKPEPSAGATILYRDIGDYLTREEKLDIVADSVLDNIEWQQVIPNAEGDWINQRNTSFEAFAPIGAKRSGEVAVFQNYSRGLATARDAWVYNYSRRVLRSNVKRMIGFYNAQVDGFENLCRQESIAPSTAHVDGFIDRDSMRISWSSSLIPKVVNGLRSGFSPEGLTTGTYRPFSKQALYFDSDLNERVYQLPKIFPALEYCNFGIYLTGTGAMKPFAVLAVDQIHDLNFWGSEGGQFFPRYTYEHTSGAADLFSDDTADGYTRIDNITDAVLADYHSTYGSEVSKDDIFYRVQKITFGKNGKIPDKSTITYNINVTLTGISTEEYGYMLGSRSAIEWIMERYQVKTDKASGIVNDPNNWATEIGDPRYIIDLLRRIVTVSLESIRLLKSLPTLRLRD